jgi:hypothetical protein
MARQRKHESAAARVRAFRAAKNLVSLSVDIPADLMAGLNDYLKFKDLTKAEVIAKLLRTQLLRRR